MALFDIVHVVILFVADLSARQNIDGFRRKFIMTLPSLVFVCLFVCFFFCQSTLSFRY